MRWQDVAAIEVDFTLDRMRFVPGGEGRAITMRPSRVASEGRHWLNLVEIYWMPDDDERRDAR